MVLMFTKELGTRKVMIYSRLENDNANPDFITGNEFARIGVVKDPLVYGSTSRLSQIKQVQFMLSK